MPAFSPHIPIIKEKKKRLAAGSAGFKDLFEDLQNRLAGLQL